MFTTDAADQSKSFLAASEGLAFPVPGHRHGQQVSDTDLGQVGEHCKPMDIREHDLGRCYAAPSSYPVGE